MRELTQRQEQIIKAAIQIISEAGLQGLSIRKLAERVGVSEPALYRHFKDKEDIMVNILKFMRDSMKSGAKWLDKLPGIEALGRLLGHIAEFAYKNPEMLETIHRIRMSQKYDNLSEEKLELDGGPDNHGLKFVEKGQVEGNIRNDIPSKYLSMMAFGTLFLLMRRWYLSGRSFDLVAEWKPVWMSLKKILENTED